MRGAKRPHLYKIKKIKIPRYETALFYMDPDHFWSGFSLAKNTRFLISKIPFHQLDLGEGAGLRGHGAALPAPRQAGGPRGLRQCTPLQRNRHKDSIRLREEVKKLCVFILGPGNFFYT